MAQILEFPKSAVTRAGNQSSQDQVREATCCNAALTGRTRAAFSRAQ